MIKKFDTYINENINNEKHTNDYNKLLKTINQLVDSDEIILKNKTPEQIVDLIIGKTQKYARFGFESFMIDTANGHLFISEAAKQRMGDYIQKIKDMGIDCSKLEDLYIPYKKFHDLWHEEDNLRDELRYYPEHDDKEGYDDINDKLENVIEEIELYRKDIEPFKEELINISKKVAEKL